MLDQGVLTAPPPPRKRVWGFWATLGFSAVVLITYFASQIVVAFAVFILRLHSSGLKLSDALEQLGSDGLTLSIAIIVSAALCCGLMLLFIKLKGGIRVAEYLAFKKISWKTILLMIAVFIVMLGASILVGFYTSGGDEQDSSFMLELFRGVWPPLLWLAVAGIGPFFEEAFFRGFLFTGLEESRLGTVATIIVTSLLWASLHIQYSLLGMAEILVMGIILGVVRQKTGSLWSSLLIHVLWNGAALAVTALYISSGSA